MIIKLGESMAGKAKIGQRRSSNAIESSEFYQDRRREIVDTAAAVFKELGYQAATISDVAEKLGTDRASLYYYFSSKKGLFQEVVRGTAELNVEKIEALAKAKMSASDKLRTAYVSMMESYSSSYPYLHVFMQEHFPALDKVGDAWDEEIRGWSDRYYVAMRQIVQQGVDEGEFEIQLPIGLATMGVIATINWAYRWYKPGGELAADLIGDGYADIILNGISAKKIRKRGRPKTPAPADR